jgi:hypothetical protein
MEAGVFISGNKFPKSLTAIFKILTSTGLIAPVEATPANCHYVEFEVACSQNRGK